ncbi:MAG: quinolinate synthase NadA [Tidjanibacter sp.]|nr:quinolinate synthase NadA [Tidjanibacter sp.]
MTAEEKILGEKIAALKAEKRAIILAHYYTRGEVQAVADFVGDSLALSQKAAEADADIILFAGVRFMAETAKVLSPSKKVLIPVLEAGCSLADSCDAADLARVKAENPDHLVVSYVNTSVEVKALTDICCTSSNALNIIGMLPEDQKVLFVPDRNLGGYINKTMGRDMKLWDGACLVHEEFSAERIAELREAHPAAKVVVHPECKAEVAALADYAGSTAGILTYCGREDVEEVIVVTESGILYELESRYPGKKFYLVPTKDGCEKCIACRDMKLVTLENIYQTLLDESPEITIEEGVRAAAEGSIRRMLEMSV